MHRGQNSIPPENSLPQLEQTRLFSIFMASPACESSGRSPSDRTPRVDLLSQQSRMFHQTLGLRPTIAGKKRGYEENS
jgi:hypothetical protein